MRHEGVNCFSRHITAAVLRKHYDGWQFRMLESMRDAVSWPIRPNRHENLEGVRVTLVDDRNVTVGNWQRREKYKIATVIRYASLLRIFGERPEHIQHSGR